MEICGDTVKKFGTFCIVMLTFFFLSLNPLDSKEELDLGR